MRRWRKITRDGDDGCAPGSMVLLTRLAKQVYRRSDEELLGMHMRLLMALSYLRDHDGAPQQELAEALCMDANNVVLLLNELEDLGHVARRRDPDDRRRHLVELDPAGGGRCATPSALRRRSRTRSCGRSTRTSARPCGDCSRRALTAAPSPIGTRPTARRPRRSRRRRPAAAAATPTATRAGGARRRSSRRPR